MGNQVVNEVKRSVARADTRAPDRSSDRAVLPALTQRDEHLGMAVVISPDLLTAESRSG
jgi:hypothetical protein